MRVVLSPRGRRGYFRPLAKARAFFWTSAQRERAIRFERPLPRYSLTAEGETPIARPNCVDVRPTSLMNATTSSPGTRSTGAFGLASAFAFASRT